MPPESHQPKPGRAAKPFLEFGRPAIGDDEIAEVVAVLRSGWIGTGPRVARFEREFAAYKEAPDAVATSSCTAALEVALEAAGIGPGDEVITTPLTFVATVNAILRVGGTPVLADVDPVTMNIDPHAVEAAITPRTRALLPVHLAGRPCAMDALTAIARQRGLVIVEDCAHAIEAEYQGRRTGTFGAFGCFSFYATKNLTTAEGGMLLAGDDAGLARARTLVGHGLSADPWHRIGQPSFTHPQAVALGHKCNMTDLQAAIGIHQLRSLERRWLRRREIWARYDAAFAGLPLTTPAPAGPQLRHALHLYTVLVDERAAGLDRDAFLRALAAQGIGAGVHYVSVAEQPYHCQRLGWRPEQWPVARSIGRTTVSLPLSGALDDGDVDDVIEAVRKALRA